MESGKIRYALLDMPLESIHKFAFKAAEATRCAGDQGKFWEMHGRLFEQQKALEPWKAHAEALKLDVAKFEECMSSGRHAAADDDPFDAEGQNEGSDRSGKVVRNSVDDLDRDLITGRSRAEDSCGL